MAGALPNINAIRQFRADIDDFLVHGQTVATDHAPAALTSLKRDLYNRKSLHWGNVFSGDDTTGDYITTNNRDQIHQMLIFAIISLVIRSYTVEARDSSWMELADYYDHQYRDLLGVAKLDTGSGLNSGVTAPNVYLRA